MNKVDFASGSGEVSLEIFCDLLEQSAIAETINLGSAVIHKITHPEFGKLVLVSTPDKNAAVRV